jgi:hypothetical protein
MVILGSIAISILLILASLPSVFAGNILTTSNKSNEIRDNPGYSLEDINGSSPLGWAPGQFFTIFITLLEACGNYLQNNSWFPGFGFAMTYLFILLCILSLAELPEHII